MRLRRTELSSPASNPQMLRKAAASEADLVLLDLEDSVAPAEKEAARQHAIAALKELDWGKKTRALRINGLETAYAYQDIITVVEAAGDVLDILMVPKVTAARDVWFVETLLEQIELRYQRSKPIGLEIIIEDVAAIQHLEAIAKASTRIEALIFGPADYAASQGMSSDVVPGALAGYPGDPWHYVRNSIAIAARAAGLEAIDGTFADFRDLEGLERECRHARVLGFSGKWVIHPNQISPVNAAFSPSSDDVAYARRVRDTYAEAEASGKGAIALDGRMIDKAVMRSLQGTLEKADLLGL